MISFLTTVDLKRSDTKSKKSQEYLLINDNTETQKRDKNVQKVINRTPKPLKKAKKLRKKKSSLFIPPSPTQYISKFPPPSPPPMSATLDKSNNNNIPPLMQAQSLPPAMMRPATNYPMNQMHVLNMMKAQSQSQKIINHQPIINNNYNPRQAFINQYQMGGANQSMPSINNNNNTGPPQMMNYNQQRQMWNNQYQYQQYLNKQMTNNNNINNNGNKQLNPKGINK